MESSTFDSIELFEGGVPAMSPMMESVWRVTAPAVLEERALSGKMILVSDKVGLFTDHYMWVHQCYPRAIYSRLRNHAAANPRVNPRAKFTCKISRNDRPEPYKALLFMNDKAIVPRASYENPNYVWHWLRALATFYTCTNTWDVEQDYCWQCRKLISRQERALLSLNILGRKINGRGMA